MQTLRLHSALRGTQGYSESYTRFVEGLRSLRPCRKAAIICLLIRELGFPSVGDIPYALAEVLDGDSVSATLVNSYLLEKSASGRERVNRHRAIAQLEERVFDSSGIDLVEDAIV
jgi:hypothetical protein